MRILFDKETPVPLRQHIPGHEIATAFELGWSSVTNGDLLAQAEEQGFDALITTDRNLRYQQNPSNHRLAILVLEEKERFIDRCWHDFVWPRFPYC